MKRLAEVSIRVSALLVLWILPLNLLAQKPPSLEEQLQAQYDTGTVLTIQKEGIFAVASPSGKICAAS